MKPKSSSKSQRKLIKVKAASAQKSAAVSENSWNLSDLKSMLKEALEYKAEAALPEIKKMASIFKQKANAMQQDLALDASEEDIRMFLFRQNPAAKILRVTPQILRFKAPKLRRVPHLPEGYGFKGGVARLGLAVIIGQASGNELVRDFDVVRFGPGREEVDNALAAQVMKEDFKHGNGVELLSSIEEYLASRDLSINEVVLTSSELICSRSAFVDTLNLVIRPTQHVRDENGVLQARVAMKMLRFYAQALAQDKQPVIEGLPERIEASSFDVALHLKRALQHGRLAAEIYLREASKRGAISLEGDLTELTQKLLAAMNK